MFTKDDILTIARGAFQPLQCDADITDHGKVLKLVVWHNDRVQARARSAVYLVKTPTTLGNFLAEVRDRLEHRRKLKFDPWTLPGYTP